MLMLIVASFSAFAQLEKGKILFGGNLNVHAERPNNVYDYYLKSNVLGINPVWGYFVNDNLALGINGGYTYAYTKEIKFSSHNFLLGPMVRYYVKANGKFALFGQASLDFEVGRAKRAWPSTRKTLTYAFNPAIRPGFVYYPTSKIGLELLMGGISYKHETSETSERKSTVDDFNINFNFRSISLGLFFYL